MLKIVLIHNGYRNRGGEDTVVANEYALLKKMGHEVAIYQVESNSIKGVLGRLKVGVSLTYSKESKTALLAYLSESKPDVVHVHNWFPLLTPSIYDACRELNIPVVQTLHNFRITCANGLLLRDGKTCHACLEGSPYLGVLHGCYQGSRLATAPVSRMIAYHRSNNTWNSKVSRFITPSRFAKKMMIEAGLEEQRITVKPHFALDPGTPVERNLTENSCNALYVGRLSPEKGIETLLKAFSESKTILSVAGDGPMKELVQASTSPSIRYVGALSRHEVSREMSRADFLIAPSECYETFGLVIVESFAHGLPVIASDNASFSELVEDKKNGMIFKSGDTQSLQAAVSELAHSKGLRQSLSTQARQSYLLGFTAEQNYRELIQIYESVL